MKEWMKFYEGWCESWCDDTLLRVYPRKNNTKQQNGGKNNGQEQSTL